MKDPERPGERRRPRVKNPVAPVVKSETGTDKTKNAPNRVRRQTTDPIEDLTTVLSQKVVGQPAAMHFPGQDAADRVGVGVAVQQFVCVIGVRTLAVGAGQDCQVSDRSRGRLSRGVHRRISVS